jgi:hypothetical protein
MQQNWFCAILKASAAPALSADDCLSTSAPPLINISLGL